MSTKYDSLSDENPVVSDDESREIVWTTHARQRWRERTPHDCGVGMLDAWRRSEAIRHPSIAKTITERGAPEAVRVYRHSDEWGVIFLIGRTDSHWSAYPWAVVTVFRLSMLSHDPSRAYLNEYGPHSPADERGE